MPQNRLPHFLILGISILLTSGCPGFLFAVNNLVSDATATASSQLDDRYPPENAIDGVISDTSRWLSADSPDPKWLLLEMPEVRQTGGFLLYSGWQNADHVEKLSVERRENGEWILIPSSVVTNNTSQELFLRFDEEVETDALRFTFTDSGIVRVREIIVWAPGDEPDVGDPGTPVDPEGPVIFLNQSGFNLGEPKRFTALGVDEDADFVVRTVEGTTVFEGVLTANIGDFTEFDPQTEDEFVVQIDETVSVPFRIGPWWLERVTYQNAVDFMIDARNHVGNVTNPSNLSYSWRDDHHFAFSLRSLVDQYLSNPAAYDRMPKRITYVTPKPGVWGALTPYDESAPDMVKMIHWGADVIVTQGLTTEMMKNELAFFLYAWPWMEQWLDPQNYQVVKAFALQHWATSTIDKTYPYNETPANGHNLLEVKTKVGSTKGSYPPGFSLLPNVLMQQVLERDGDAQSTVYRDAARAQAAWLIENLDLENPQVTKGQRMSENFLMMGLAAFARLDSAGLPEGFDAFINLWADVAIRRSGNFWDFRKLDDADKWAPYVAGSATQWNEPGNVVGLPAAALEAAALVTDPQKAQRLREISWAAIDNMFGRNPVGRHFSYDAPREIEGVENGWFSFHQGGVGQLRDVPFVLDGSPKDPHYPYSPELGNIGWTEGWVSFNTAYNRSLAVLAYQSTSIQLVQRIGSIEVTLTAPLNFDYTTDEPVTLIVTTDNGDREEITLQEVHPFAREMQGTLPTVSSTEPVPDNGTLEIAPGAEIRTSYGLGYYEKSAELTVTDLSSLDSDNDGLPDAWELEYYDSLETINGEMLTGNDGTSALMEFVTDRDPRQNNATTLAIHQENDALGHWMIARWRENTGYAGAHAVLLYRSNDLNDWEVVIFDGINATRRTENPDVDGDGTARLIQARLRIPPEVESLYLKLRPVSHL